MSKRGKYGQGRVYQPTYKAPDGRIKTVSKFYIQYYDLQGVQHRESTEAKSETEARKLLAVKLGQAVQGLGPVNGEKSLRYGDLREDLLRHYRTEKKKSLEVLSNGEESLKGLTKLDEFFGFVKGAEKDESRKVSAITSNDWADNFIAARRREGVSDATIRNSAVLLRQMLNLAVEHKRISFAPYIAAPKAPDARKEYLSKEQFDTLLNGGMDKRFHILLKFLFYQGVRINETLAITWNQFDLDAGVFMPRASDNKTGNATPKPLHPEVVKALRPTRRANGLVFEDLSKKMFEKAFRKAMLELGYGKSAWQCGQCKSVEHAPPPKDDRAIPCDDCKGVPMQYHYVGPSPHCLRASAVVFYRESGMADAEIMAITGHSNPKSFLGYSRTRTESIKEKMAIAGTKREQIKREDRKTQLKEAQIA